MDKHLLFVMTFLLFSFSVHSKEDKILERSHNIMPQWVNAVESNYIITTATGESVELARKQALNQVKEQILFAVAVHVESETMISSVQEINGNNVKISEETYHNIRLKASDIPYISGISLSCIEDYYWEKVKKSRNVAEYHYSIKYPFEKDQLNKLISDFIQRKKYANIFLDSLEYKPIVRINDFVAITTKLNNLLDNNIFGDSEINKRCALILKQYCASFPEIIGNAIMHEYMNVPADGCRIIKTPCDSIITSTITLNTINKSNSELSRIAVLKSTRQMNEFFNKSKFLSETTFDNSPDSYSMNDKIHISSEFVSSTLELLISFRYNDTEKVFVYFKKIK